MKIPRIAYSIMHRKAASYKQFFQISPKDDLTKARLLSAQDKLSSGLPYEEIAESLGFGSSEYFYKWYRAHLGASPKTVAHKK